MPGQSQLTGPQYEAIAAALLQAFDYNSLARLLRQALDYRLELIASKYDGFATVVQETLRWAEREGRVDELLAAAKAFRPQVAWPDLPSLATQLPEGAPAPARPPGALPADQVLAIRDALFSQVTPILLPHVWSVRDRQDLLLEAFYTSDSWVLGQIEVDGPANAFIRHCLVTLWERDPRLLEILLIKLRSRCGEQDRPVLQTLLATLEPLSRRQPPSVSSHRPAGATMPTLAPGREAPVIFVSCGPEEAYLRPALQAALAGQGHACWPDVVAAKGSDEWRAAVTGGLSLAYAVVLLIGPQTYEDYWVRLELLAAREKRKRIIPVLLGEYPLPAGLPPGLAPLRLAPAAAEDVWLALLPQLPPRPAAAGHEDWVTLTPELTQRAAELVYMDRLKLAELQHVARYTRLSGQSAIRRTAGGQMRLNPVVARQEFSHAPWRREPEPPLEQRTFEDAVTELQAIRRAVLLGEPGSGKTTTLYRLAADLLEAALLDRHAPLPLMFRLGLWTDAAEPFPAFLRRSVGELGDGLAARLAAGHAALLLDGLNELPADQQADKYGQVRDFLAQQPQLLVWVSCRAQDYPPERELRLDRVTVSPLDPPRVQAFIHNYLHDLPGYGPPAAGDLFWRLAGEQAQETYQRFMAALGAKLADPDRVFWLANRLPDGLTWGIGLSGFESLGNYLWDAWLRERARPGSLLRLATNPYMLFMLLDVYQAYERRLPANRGQLFDRFVETLLVRERLWARETGTGRVHQHPAGNELLARLTALAYAMQQQRTDGGALTALPLATASQFLGARQRYQAASANLLTLGDEVRFAHQLLQEYFVARAMRERIFPSKAGTAVPPAPSLAAADIWSPENWWEPTNWEEATILLAGLYSDDCTPVLDWLAGANPELAARCIVESGAHTPEETKVELRDHWLPRLTGRGPDHAARARAAVGRALGRVRLVDGTPLDPRPGVGTILRSGQKLPDIVWGGEIPAGTYTIGSDARAYGGNAEKQTPIEQPYRLARYPVTYAQFQCFVDAPDFGDERWWAGMPAEEEAYGQNYRLREMSEQAFLFDNHPREMVSWYQAMAFARWLTARLHAGVLPAGTLTGDVEQYEITLPHENEWEVAARWPNSDVAGRLYPWGREFDAAKANTEEGGIGQTTAVGIYPAGQNAALGLYDLSGNVWEWCRNKYKNPDDEAVDGSGAWRVLRGGSWFSGADDARAASRYDLTPAHRSSLFGFRLVVVGGGGASSPIS